MEFFTVKKSDPEKIFTICRNIMATTAYVGDAAAYDYGVGGEHNGVDAKLPQADSLDSFVGIWVEQTPRSSYGRVQMYGHCDYIQFGGTTIAPGNAAKPVDAKPYMQSVEAAGSHLGFVVCGSVVNAAGGASSTGFAIGWIRAM